MINEKMLIKELSNNSIFEKVTVGEETVYDVINRLPKLGEWISCKYKFPMVGETVLASLNLETLIINHPIIVTTYRMESYWYDNTILAWQPLPEPYKEEE